MRISLVIMVALGMIVAPGVVHAGDNCRLLRQASFELGTDWYGGAYVPARIGGLSMRLLVDTGGTVSTLTQGTMGLLGVEGRRVSSQRMTMFGGMRLDRFVWIDDVQIGSVSQGTTRFLALPDDRLPDALSGTVAPDFLSRYDVEFDFANAKLNLFSPDRCGGRVVYWTDGAYAKIPIQLDQVGHILAFVQLDGKKLAALIDTGLSRSELSLEAAENLFGLAGNSRAIQPWAEPAGGDRVYHYSFRKLSFGDETVADPDIALIPDSISRRSSATPKLILGMNVLRHYHLYVAYREHNLYVTAASAR